MQRRVDGIWRFEGFADQMEAGPMSVGIGILCFGLRIICGGSAVRLDSIQELWVIAN